jgi:hypothetical protein
VVGSKIEASPMVKGEKRCEMSKRGVKRCSRYWRKDVESKCRVEEGAMDEAGTMESNCSFLVGLNMNRYSNSEVYLVEQVLVF